MRKFSIILIIAALLITAACGKKDQSARSIEQIYKLEGVPVRVTNLEPTSFKSEIVYNAVISGAEESTSTAMLADVITQIHASVGQRVNQGDLIVSYPSNSPQAQNEQARTGFEMSQQTYHRMQRLFEQGAISRQDLDGAKAGYDVAEANLAASNAMIRITAPISGVITDIMVNTGERTYPGQPLFTIAGGNGYKAIINISETDIALIKRNLPVQATWNGHTMSGRISQIALAMDQGTKSFRVEALFQGNNRSFHYGVTAELLINTGTKNNVIVVNREHIRTESGVQYVWIMQDGKAVKREIQTGMNNHLSFEVTSGLEAGDQLITQGIDLLNDGATVKLIP